MFDPKSLTGRDPCRGCGGCQDAWRHELKDARACECPERVLQDSARAFRRARAYRARGLWPGRCRRLVDAGWRLVRRATGLSPSLIRRARDGWASGDETKRVNAQVKKYLGKDGWRVLREAEKALRASRKPPHLGPVYARRVGAAYDALQLMLGDGFRPRAAMVEVADTARSLALA